MSTYKEKCKKHIMFSDYTPDPTDKPMKGFEAYPFFGMAFIKLLPHFLPVFWHNMTCPDNPYWAYKSEFNYQKYDKHIPDWYKNIYHIANQTVQQITETKAITLK